MTARALRSVPTPSTQRDQPARALRLAVFGSERHADLPVRATLRRWVLLALHRKTAAATTPTRIAPPAQGADLSLAFVDARAARRLNREFRHRDYATNVLTFAYERHPRLAADIVICVPVVRREAREQGKTLRQHLAHLVIHGVLHALGFDHERMRDARIMQDLERRILAELRISDPYRVS